MLKDEIYCKEKCFKITNVSASGKYNSYKCIWTYGVYYKHICISEYIVPKICDARTERLKKINEKMYNISWSSQYFTVRNV